MIFGFLFNFFGDKIEIYMFLMTRSLQLILHLPIMQVVLPANVIVFIGSAINFVMFDIFFGYEVWEYIPNIHFNPNIQSPVLNRMQNVNYKYRNSYQDLGALTFILFLYLLRVFLSIILKLSILIFRIKKEKSLLIKSYNKMSENVFFNQIIGLSLEAYMEFYINGLLNLQTPDFSTNGEILGMLLASFISFMIHIVIPFLLLYLQFTNLKRLKSKEIRSQIGVLYSNKKYKTKF